MEIFIKKAIIDNVLAYKMYILRWFLVSLKKEV